MNYPTYNNQYYMQNLQDMRDRIDTQIRNYQQSQQQPITQPITQNFQLAPTNNAELEGRYAENIDAVKSTFVMRTGIFVNKDLTTMWLKDTTGKIRTFSVEEIFEEDEKDKEINALKRQIIELRGMIGNEHDDTNANEQITETKSTRVSNNKKSNGK